MLLKHYSKKEDGFGNMKSLLIALKNLKAYIKNKDRYLGIIFISTIAVTIGTMFIQGYYIEYTFNYPYKTKSVVHLKEDHSTQDVEALLDEIVSNKELIYSLKLYSDKKIVSGTPELDSGGPFNVVGAYSKAFEEKKLSGTSFDIDSKEKCIILGISTANHLKVSDFRSLYDLDYRAENEIYKLKSITAADASDFRASLPPLTYGARYRTDIVEICFFDNIKAVKQSRLMKRINNSEMVEYVEHTDRTNLFWGNPFLSAYIVVYLVFAVFLINAAGLLLFWMKRQSHRVIIYRMIGASQKLVFKIIFSEILVIYMVSVLAGNCFFALVVLALRGSRVIYTKNATPYFYIASVFVISLIVFSAIASKITVKQKEIYRTRE